MRAPIGPLSAKAKALLRRLADILTIYGHGLLAFGFGKAFVGELDAASILAIAFGVAAHAAACYISFEVEA